MTDPAGVPEWDLADRLRKSLRHADVGVEQLADELGYSRKSIGNYLNGRSVPRRSAIVAWALRCGVSARWLETGEGPTNPPKSGPGQVIDGIGWFGRIAAPRPELHLAETG